MNGRTACKTMIWTFRANERLNVGKIIALACYPRCAQCDLTISGNSCWRIWQNNHAVRTVTINGNARVMWDVNLENGNDDFAVGDDMLHCQAETIARHCTFTPASG